MNLEEMEKEINELKEEHNLDIYTLLQAINGWGKNHINLEGVLRDDYKFKIENLPDNELKKHYEGLLEKLNSKKEYIASLNDPKAFEAVNLGVLKRDRKGSGGEKEEEISVVADENSPRLFPKDTDHLDSKLPELNGTDDSMVYHPHQSTEPEKVPYMDIEGKPVVPPETIEFGGVMYGKIEEFLKGWYELDNELILEGKVRVTREKIEEYEGMLK